MVCHFYRARKNINKFQVNHHEVNFYTQNILLPSWLPVAAEST